MSRWGANRGDPAYDAFRTGLTYREVRRMLWVHDNDRSRWRHKRRGTVLGLWHEIKLSLYAQMQDDQQRRAA